ncbi:MAG: nucleoside-diphosphate sugar epimerase [Ignavibacteriae bacterium HGW-Ignavibacteriae-1]|nr:MAG: nucleoside-diphosphate sugar epimerase [Ignavibacteriae bacterium HGW-Ignavibacteriae-1]
MFMSKIIAITGATGAQGGSLARAILNDPQSNFKVRAITRNPKSENAMKLVEMGAEVVQADLDDVDSLRRAFDGAHGAFCLTNFWEHFSPEKEIQQAANLAQAAKDAGVKHAVWSTFNDTRNWVPLDDDRMPTLQGKYKVPHLDSKGEANAKFAALGVPTTYLLTSFYWDNMIYFGMGPQRGPDGVLGLTLPMGDKKLPGMAAEDIGKCAYGIFKKGDSYIGKSVGIAGEHLTGYEMASALTKAVGQTVRYNDVPADVYRGFGFPGADDLGNMFQFKRDFNDVYCGERNLDESHALNPELQSFEKWLNVNVSKIAIPE